jgi:molybdopterin converting factor small subunit
LIKVSFGIWSTVMKIQVEFLGLSRLVTGVKVVSLDLKEGATFRDIVRTLVTTYPALLGNVIQSNREALQEPNIFNLNAKKMIQANQMDSGPSDGDRVILMSMSAGG